jgi:hypothetical protein
MSAIRTVTSENKLRYGRRHKLSGQFERMEWNGKTIHKFLEQSEQFGKICQWTDSNFVNITALLKLSGEAPFFVRGPSETEPRGISFEQLKQKLTQWFGKVLPLQYYYTLQHVEKQGKIGKPETVLGAL